MNKNPYTWDDTKQNYLESNWKNLRLSELAKALNTHEKLVQIKRKKLLESLGIERAYFTTNSDNITILYKPKKSSIVRPPAEYSNRSPYGIASPGLAKRSH